MTHINKNALSEEQLKDRLDFTKMFDRQAGQIQQTKHIKNLLTPREELREVGHFQPAPNKDYEVLFNEKIDSLENKLLHHLDNINKAHKKQILLDFSGLKLDKILAGAIVLGSLIIGIALIPKKEIIEKEKIVYKNLPIKNPSRSVVTKFVNLRQSPSSKGLKLETLAPNSIVEILESKNDWKKLEFKDHLNNKTVIGWVYGENLKNI